MVKMLIQDVLSISDCTESNVMKKGENNMENFGSKLSWPK